MAKDVTESARVAGLFVSASRLIPCLLLVVVFAANAQEGRPSDMTQSRLHDLIVEVGTDVLIADNLVRFTFAGRELICISDVNADRMRIVSPAANVTDLGPEELLMALAANFHSALDVRYAISDGVVYAAFIHPLSPLTEGELLSAVRQVAAASITFGETYSSGELFFEGGRAP